jgi:hypothetical protein
MHRLALLLSFGLLVSPALAEQECPPNIVFIYCDNLGYGDTEPFGSKKHRTPNLNRMAREGRKFTHFYLAYKSRTRDGKTVTAKPRLYDVRRDAGETNNVVDQHADVVARLIKHAEQGRAELGDQGLRGRDCRPHGLSDNPTPRIK